MTHRDIACAVLAVALASSIHAQTTVKTNDDPDLPINTGPGDRVLTYDFPAFHIGIAEYPDGPIGVTVLHFPNGADFACVVLNAIGAVFDRDGRPVRGHVDPATGERTTYMEDIERQVEAARQIQDPQPGITTITVVVTNQTVRGHDLIQLGRQVHSSTARAIQPFHTRDDGDALWMVSTGEVERPEWSLAGIGVVASEVVWVAVLAAHP